MRSAPRGKSTSTVEVTNVSVNGLWLLLDGDELFLAFTQFPWFRDASIGQLVNVERPAVHHLYWPTNNSVHDQRSRTSPACVVAGGVRREINRSHRRGWPGLSNAGQDH